MNHKLPAAALGGVVLFAALAGCSSKDKGGESIAITATDTACEVATTELPSGSTTFAVTNKGGDVTEVYVYGDGDKVMGEVENIGPGTSRDFTADLGAGTYEVACKPGQKGDGIRTEITVSGTATTQAAAERTVAVEGYDFGYHGMMDFSATVGETVEFTLTNTATDQQHELEITSPDGNVLGEVGPTDPGKTGSVTITFTKPGTYVYQCGITDHAEKGMKGEFTVTAA
jgi:plastocyanin